MWKIIEINFFWDFTLLRQCAYKPIIFYLVKITKCKNFDAYLWDIDKDINKDIDKDILMIQYTLHVLYLSSAYLLALQQASGNYYNS